jgi:hypothetical protein
MPHPSHSSWFYYLHNSGWGVQIIKLLIMKFPTPPVTSSLLRPKYSLQHPILKHPQQVFFPQCQWPCFTHIQNYRQNYSSVYSQLPSILEAIPPSTTWGCAMLWWQGPTYHRYGYYLLLQFETVVWCYEEPKNKKTML